jgi:NAD(P)-dependent dehydrogenase (short-subunit alcohol dehydrogenase family)
MVSGEFLLNGKVVIVAGTGRFWAKYVAAALAEAGADVAVAGKNARKVQEAVAEVQRLGRKSMGVPTDLTQFSQIQKMVEQVVTRLGKVDILVNCNDVRFARPALEITKGEWHRVLDANLTSVFLCCQAVGKEMLERKKGRIINITSVLADRGLANSSAYCAAMGGVLQLTRALNIEWARQGITVNAIGAGWFSETDQLGLEGEDALLRYLPLKRYGQPKEIGSLVVYLASDATDYVTGQFLYVDGAVTSHL